MNQQENIRFTTKALTWVVIVMAVFYTAKEYAARSPFRARETAIIQRSDSVMYVTTLEADSLLLRTPSRDLSEKELKSKQFRTLCEKMLMTVTSPQQDGVGIAAPQVGIDVRLAAVQRFDLPGEPFQMYPNLRIDSLWGEVTHGPEGCLSVPPLRGLVPRHSSAAISWTDPETLETKRDTIHGYTAIIFQHECDHLEGILYIDKADTLFTDEAWQKERAQFDWTRPAYIQE